MVGGEIFILKRDGAYLLMLCSMGPAALAAVDIKAAILEALGPRKELSIE